MGESIDPAHPITGTVGDPCAEAERAGPGTGDQVEVRALCAEPPEHGRVEPPAVDWRSAAGRRGPSAMSVQHTVVRRPRA
ncbi:hypothetical protein [Streptomyces coelicoflavus]|uniref:hypothetical protein n=1 Tax=Streptomyces coelicoflavus TaxID=285562 RepID=UPI003A8418E4